MAGGLVGSGVTPAELAAMQVSGSVDHLLSQTIKNGSTGIELQLDQPKSRGIIMDFIKPAKSEHVLQINSKGKISPEKAQAVVKWLANPELKTLNCGVYALQYVLAEHGIHKTPEEIAVLTIASDIYAGIVQPGDPQLKISLNAMPKVARAYGFDYEAARLAPEDVLKLPTPFIAHFKDEHFVAVTHVSQNEVLFNDMGAAARLTRDEFVSRLSGFVMVEDLRLFFKAGYDRAPPEQQAFVWGSKTQNGGWVDNSNNLPGLFSTSQVMMSTVMSVGMAVAGMFLGGAGFSGAQLAFSLAAGSFSSAVGEYYTIKCLQKAADSGKEGQDCEKNGFLLSNTLSGALTGGIVGAVMAYVKGMVMWEVKKMLTKALCNDEEGCTLMQSAIVSVGTSIAGFLAGAAVSNGMGMVSGAFDGSSGGGEGGGGGQGGSSWTAWFFGSNI
ncbi:MAG: hypothetical protein HQL18_04375, partial [Candidatus Omnitrophica bacterium]|nr:hypothetical protein [Candidatus Omnitrophota bacterium]